MERKLSAILFADIEGYTAMMESDEDSTMSRLQRYQHVLEAKINEFNGELIKSYGDGSLSVFPTVLECLKCARDIQIELRKEPQVPLRIGLHLGDVTFRDGDVYGNDINIASRIESMGVSGSILMSEEFVKKVQNKSEFDFKSLGHFKFKNVGQELEVFALANGLFIIPEKSDIRGKLAEEPHKKKNLVILTVCGLLVAALVAYMAIINQGGNSSHISNENSTKRLAVLNFQNQTNNPDLESYSVMFSDWITRGLMNLDNANVISASNIQSKIAEASLGGSANLDFSNSTGVDLVIEGRYYYAEDRLIAIANLLDIRNGEVLKTFQLEEEKSQLMNLLDEITDNIISYWAVKDNVQFSSDPPNYDAYKTYLEGMRLQSENAREAAAKFEQAFNLDSTFFLPLFRMYGSYYSLADFDKTAEIISYVNSKKSMLTKFERETFNALQAYEDKDYLLAAQHYAKLAELDSSDMRAIRSSAYAYYISNRPQKTLDMLTNIDGRLIEENANISWTVPISLAANYKLEKYKDIIRIAEDYSLPKIPVILAVFHIQSLIQLDSFETLRIVYDDYNERGVYSPVGGREAPYQLLSIICSELYLKNYTNELKYYNSILESWIRENELPDFPHHLPDLFNSRPFTKSQIEGYVSFFKGDYRNALESWREETIPDSNWPDVIEWLSRKGHCYAKLNDPSRANGLIEKIEELEIDHIYGKLTKQYYKSRIYAALGKMDMAVREIQRALDNGLVIYRPMILKSDPFLKDLIGNESFEELVRPRGN